MIVTIDIETKRGLRAQPDNFLLGTLYNLQTDKYETFHSPNEMYQYIKTLAQKQNKWNKKLYIYSANHSFDWMLYGDQSDPDVVTVNIKMFIKHLMEDDKQYKIRCDQMAKENKPAPPKKRAYATFLDIFSIYNSSIRSTTSAGLERIGQLINEPKAETPSYLIGESLSVEDTAKLTFTPKQMRDIEKYCKQDSYVVAQAYRKIKQKLADEGLRVNTLYTIHQIAMNRFFRLLVQHKSNLVKFNMQKRQYTFPPVQYPCRTFSGYTGRFHSRFCRGGINQAYITGQHDETYKVDCNGFWQSELARMTIPDLASEHRIEQPLKYSDLDLLLSKTGYSYAIIQCPDIDFGILPVRILNEGTLNNVFPNNKSIIVGHYTNYELAYAVSIGYKVLYIDYSVLFLDSNDQNIQYIVRETYNQRKKSRTAFDDWFYKQMGNSFVGKFTQATASNDVKVVPIDEIEYYKKLNYHVISASDTHYTVEKNIGLYDKPFYAPILYAYITARARVQHHKVIRKFGPDKVCYVDTDSLVLRNTTYDEINTVIKIGDKLGQWKFENKRFDKANLPIPETTIIWKEKYYKFADEKHMSGIPLKNLLELDININTKSVIRQRLITEKMAKHKHEIGTLTSEEISLEARHKPTRNIYIDQLYEDTDTMAEQLFKIKHGDIQWQKKVT